MFKVVSGTSPSALEKRLNELPEGNWVIVQAFQSHNANDIVRYTLIMKNANNLEYYHQDNIFDGSSSIMWRYH